MSQDSPAEELAREGRTLREALGGARPRRSGSPSRRNLLLAAFALLMLAGLGSVALDLVRPAAPQGTGYVRRELLIEFRLPGGPPAGAVVTVLLLDVPATLTRAVKELEKGDEDSYRLVWQGELARAPQRLKGRLQAPGWKPVESEEVLASGDGQSFAAALPPLQLRQQLKPRAR